MGCCSSICGKSAEETNLVPSPEARRQQQLEAAEKRRIENERRGIKNPGAVHRQQKRAEEIERRENEAERKGTGGAALRWQAN